MSVVVGDGGLLVSFVVVDGLTDEVVASEVGRVELLGRGEGGGNVDVDVKAVEVFRLLYIVTITDGGEGLGVIKAVDEVHVDVDGFQSTGVGVVFPDVQVDVVPPTAKGVLVTIVFVGVDVNHVPPLGIRFDVVGTTVVDSVQLVVGLTTTVVVFTSGVGCTITTVDTGGVGCTTTTVDTATGVEL